MAFGGLENALYQWCAVMCAVSRGSELSWGTLATASKHKSFQDGTNNFVVYFGEKDLALLLAFSEFKVLDISVLEFRGIAYRQSDSLSDGRHTEDLGRCKRSSGLDLTRCENLSAEYVC